MGKKYIAAIWMCIVMLCGYSQGYSTSSSCSYPSDDRSRHVDARGSGDSKIRRHESTGNSTELELSRYDGVSFVSGRVYGVGNESTSAKPGNRAMPVNTRNLLYPGVSGPKISKYISYKEATYSYTAVVNKINNDPNPSQLAVMTNLGLNFFDKLREYYAKPLYITSFFRSVALNRFVGGALFSDHMANNDSSGIDIDMDGKAGPTNNELFHHIKDNMVYYKLIAEFPKKGKASWVHVSYSTVTSKNNQKNVYIAMMQKTRKVYLPYKGNEYLLK